MPVFTRRRLQQMLDELAERMDRPKLKDVRARLESKRVEQALPAEMELGVLWSLSKLGDVEIEPEWFGRRRPDAYTEELFKPTPCAVEVTAISDARLAQEEDMRRIATRVCDFANTVRKGFGKHLHFTFGEESGYTVDGYMRRRKIDQDFTPDDATQTALRQWLWQPDRGRSLEIKQGKTHFLVKWHDTEVHPHSNFFCSMPAQAFSLEDNPLFDALADKKKQLALPGFEGLRCIVVADVGARLIRDVDPSMRSMHEVTGRQVIDHFLRRADDAVDAVIALAPRRVSSFASWKRDRKFWQAELFVRPGVVLKRNGVDALIAELPVPRFEGYQARSLQQQAAYRPDAQGWYVGTNITSARNEMTFRISARAVLDLMAGRITHQQFEHFTGVAGNSFPKNLFAHRLDEGDTLASIEIEPGGVDEDDDRLIIRFKRDPAAAPLTVNAVDAPMQAD